MRFNTILTILFLVATLRSCQARSGVVAVISPHGCTTWGDWGPWQYCPDGQFVNGFQLKAQRNTGGDDTALDIIKLWCDNGNYITGQPANWIKKNNGVMVIFNYDRFGTWGANSTCYGHYTAAKFRSECSQGIGDDTAGNNLALYCSYIVWEYGDGLGWGSWSSEVNCPSHSVICGLRTQIEAELFPQPVDNTALNNVQFACCSLPRNF